VASSFREFLVSWRVLSGIKKIKKIATYSNI
jgi:hypothetical protein